MTIAVFVVILALSVVVALLSKIGVGKVDIDQYIVAGRSFSGFLLFFLSVGEIYSIGTMIAFPGGIYAKGASYGIWFLGYILLAYPVGYFVGPLIWRAGKRYNALTGPDVFRAHFRSRTLEVITAIAIVFYLVFWAQYQFVGLEVALSALGLPVTSGITTIVAIVIAFIYVLLTGVRAPALVSILKDTTMILGIVVVGVLAVNAVHGVPHLFDQAVAHRASVTMTGAPLVYAVTTIVVQALAFYMGTTSTAFLFTSRSEQTVRRTTIVQPLYMLMYPFLVFASYYSLTNVHLNNPNLAFTAASRALGPGWVVGLAAGAAALAGVLVLAALALTLGAVVSRNFVTAVAAEAQHRWVIVIVAVFLVLSAFLALSIQTLMLAVLTFAYLIAAQLVPAWIAVLYGRRVNAFAVGAGIVVGLAIAITLQLTNAPLGGVNAGLVAMVVNFVVMFGLGYLMTTRPFRKTPAAVEVEPVSAMGPPRRAGSGGEPGTSAAGD